VSLALSALSYALMTLTISWFIVVSLLLLIVVSSFCSPFHFSAFRIALEPPNATRAEAGSGAECILHELHIGDLPVLDPAEDRERRTDLLPHS
jgi:hypothetical protein